MDIDFDLSSLPPDASSEKSLILRLQRAWITERAAPEILPYGTRLLDTISTRLKEQVRPQRRQVNLT